MRAREALINDAVSENTLHSGLTEKEADRKLKEHGPNAITHKKKISPLKILFEQFTDIMIIILLISTAVSAFMGEITEAVTIIAIVVVNAILGFVQEFRTEKTLEALKQLAAPAANAIRSGRVTSIPAEQVVPGDVILLDAGDRVPADADIIECSSLQVDESLLTGESVPVEKVVTSGGRAGRRMESKSGSGTAKRSSVYMGTIVTGGRAKALVYSTGMNTEMGHIADMIQNIEEDQTPLQKRLEHLGKLIAIGCLLICAVVAVTGVLRGEDLFVMLLAGISLAVAAVPEGLPAIVTISLALGVQRMLKRNALIRKLPAVETLGCASVICSDKTGTLTENRMTVRKIFACGVMTEVEGSSLSTGGVFSVRGKAVKPAETAALKLALEIGALCNNAILTKAEQNGGRSNLLELSGDPTEGALLVAAAKAGIMPETLEKEYNRVFELPFDSDRKCMSVVCRNKKGESFIYVKGAPDVIIKKCKSILTKNGTVELTNTESVKILGTNDQMAGEALRVLGVAYRRLGTVSSKNSEIEKELVFVGLVGMIDPPRKEAADAVRICRLAGIKPVMITGDHKITAAAIARELYISQSDNETITGDEIEKLGENGLERVAPNVSVYARVSPKHKLMIVRALRKLGHVVAMTGDGVNDAPALKEADIGVAMGVTGTDVTKEASSMILLDDNFATIVAAVEEGRVIYNNIRKFIRYLLACNIGEVLTMFVGMLIGLPIPLLPIQILWVNLVTDGLPAIALGLDPPARDVMLKKPRGQEESIFSHGLLALILFRGGLIGFCTLAVFTTVMSISGSVESARTAAFAILVLTQLIHVFECKSETKSIFEIPLFNNILLVLAVLSSLAMLFAVLYIPFLQEIFKTVRLTMDEWVIIGGFSFLGPVLASFFKFDRR